MELCVVLPGQDAVDFSRVISRNTLELTKSALLITIVTTPMNRHVGSYRNLAKWQRAVGQTKESGGNERVQKQSERSGTMKDSEQQQLPIHE
jgi:hypothetical protein